MDPEEQIFALLEMADQQQKSIDVAVKALGATREQLTQLMKETRESAVLAATQSVKSTLQRDMAPIIEHLNASAAHAHQHWRFALWRQVAVLAATAVLGGLVGGVVVNVAGGAGTPAAVPAAAESAPVPAVSVPTRVLRRRREDRTK